MPTQSATTPTAAPRVILGIDPGTNVMGYAVVRIDGKAVAPQAMGVIKLSKFESHYERLHRIYERIAMLTEQYTPDAMAIEAPFFGKNVQSMLKLGRAQGVAIAAALTRNLSVHEYEPRKVKMSITGNGAASKEQVAAMLVRILGLPNDWMPKYFDATDALAVALCHHYESSRPHPTGGGDTWASFIAKNPDRVKGFPGGKKG